MKKKIMSLIALSLVGTMMVTSLTGCGLQTKATDITVDDGDTIIVDQEDMETEETEPETDVADTEDTNTEDTNSDEITGEEVVGDDTEDEEELGDTNYNGIILFAEKESKDFDALDALDEIEYTSYNGYLTAESYVPILDGDGYWIGSIEPGTTVSITGMSTDLWARFENPIEGIDYDYLYVRNEMVTSERIHLNATTMKEGLENYINTYGFEEIEYTFLNENASDMEFYEFRMDSEYEDQMMYEYWIGELISDGNVNPLHYGTLYIECEEDTDGWIICRVYYKDLIEFEN